MFLGSGQGDIASGGRPSLPDPFLPTSNCFVHVLSRHRVKMDSRTEATTSVWYLTTSCCSVPLQSWQSLPTSGVPSLPELLEHSNLMFPKLHAGKAGKASLKWLFVLQLWLIYS